MDSKKYIPRLVDNKIDNYLSVMGAVCIEGPKWCGKTMTALKHSKSATYLDDEATRERAEIEVKSIFNEEEKRPQLIDEWHLVPSIWDATRRAVDFSSRKGNFILTGSTTLPDEEQKKKIFHSGAGRIAKIKMCTMSLYESGDSNGKASITDMLEGTQESINTGEVELNDIANLIIRGGWPENIDVDEDKIGIIPEQYIESLLNIDLNKDGKKRSKDKMLMLLRSLSRNESTLVSNQTIIKDMSNNFDKTDVIETRDTLRDYLDVLERLYIVENQDAFSINYRSSNRVAKSAKRHLTDPSLCCACLNLTKDKLFNDLNTFGFMFESLVERDLRIYADYLDAKLLHFRDNNYNVEVDAIMEFKDGEYAAFEIKLGTDEIKKAIKNLVDFYENVKTKPKFMCVISGKASGIVKDSESGVYIVPITALKP